MLLKPSGFLSVQVQGREVGMVEPTDGTLGWEGGTKEEAGPDPKGPPYFQRGHCVVSRLPAGP